MRISVSILLALFMVFPAVSRAEAQSAHAATPAALDAALQQHVTSTAADREDVLRVLDNAEVKSVAGRMGVDLRTAKTAITTLDGEQLATLATQARQVDQALAGGASTIVISTTTIIIALLLVILIVIAAK
jgi:hypothetical protein